MVIVNKVSALGWGKRKGGKAALDSLNNGVKIKLNIAIRLRGIIRSAPLLFRNGLFPLGLFAFADVLAV